MDAGEPRRNQFVEGMAVLVGFQLAGELVVRTGRLPVPAAVVGLFLLFLWLLWRGRVPQGLQLASNALLDNLALLFVPATVGALLDIATIASEALAIAVAVVASTLLAMGAASGTFLGLERLQRRERP